MIRILSRYVGVQLLAYVIDMSVFLLGTGVAGLAPLPANVVAKLAAGTFAFIAHRRITFRVHGQRGTAGQAWKYVALLLLNIPMTSAVLALLLPVLAPPALAKFVSDVACMAVTFVLSRYLVFTVPSPKEPAK